MELEDCDEILHNFKGGTLELNPEESKTPTSEHNLLISDIENHTENHNGRVNAIISPIVSIPQRISDKVWPKRNDQTPKNVAVKPAMSVLIDGNANDFFTFRQSIIQQAVNECVEFFLEDCRDEAWTAFLLTQISLWDAEKERLLLITSKNMIVIKYDFIALRKLDYKIVPLQDIDTVLIGDLVYPTSSLVPRINGFVDGLSSVVQRCLFDAWTKNKPDDLSDYFYPSNRNMQGVRIMWNKGKPLNFGNKWNPLSTDVPFITFTAHPLFFHKDCTNDDYKKIYNLDEFTEKLLSTLSRNGFNYLIHHKNILMENYVGIGSLIHNRNGLGFFKVRGRFSF